jgi:hypothetical protein
MSTTFKDIKGRDWTIKIKISDFIAMKEQDLCDLEKLFDDQEFLGGILDGGNIIKFLGILHQLCKGQYADHDIDDEGEFFESLDGDSISQASEAFIFAAINFLPVHRRETMTESYQTLRMGLEKSGETAASSMKKHRKKLLEDMDKEVKKKIEESTKGTT